MDELVETINRFVSVLDELGIVYAIGGSVASSAVGYARSTRDIDMVASMSSEEAVILADRLEKDFYLDKLAAARAIADGDCFNAIDLKTLFQIDVFVPRASDWLRSQLQRRVVMKIGGEDGIQVYVCSPEDVVLSKLAWFRLGNEVSEHQMRDVTGVLKVQKGKLDNDYLNQWSQYLAVQDLLERARLGADKGI